MLQQHELDVMVEDHILWLDDVSKGSQLDLSYQNLQDLKLKNVNLSWDNFRSANLEFVNFSRSNLKNACLYSANLRFADLQMTDLRQADMRFTNLTSADLREADLRDTQLDFSSGIPFHCGGTEFIGDDRLFSQMVFHLTRADWSNCSEEIKRSMEIIKNLPIANNFCLFRTDLEKL